MILRHALLIARDLLLSGVRTGRWWLVVIVPLMWLAALAVFVTKVAVPTVIYAFA